MFNVNTGFFDLVMVGMRHIDSGKFYEQIKRDPSKYRFILKPEPTNPEDVNALAVYASEEGAVPRKLGYIKKEHAYILNQKYLLDNKSYIRVTKTSRYNLHYAILHVSKQALEDAQLKQEYEGPCDNEMNGIADALSYTSKTYPDKFAAEYTTANSYVEQKTLKDEIEKIQEALKITQKEKEMANNTVNNVLDKNTAVAKTAAYLEAGRIANNQATKFIASKSPLMVRGYVDTPFGKLVVANIASIAATKFRGDDKRIAKLTEAMMVEAWQEIYQMVDVEKMINEMLNSESIKKALSKLDDPEVV